MNQIKKDWDIYWVQNKNSRFLYNLIASFYRNYIIKNNLNYYTKKYFSKDSLILHAGCGGGEVDCDIQKYFKIIPFDISSNALKLYLSRYKNNNRGIQGDVRNIKTINKKVDGIYNLGVMEHYNKKDIEKIFLQFNKVLKKNKYIILFWPSVKTPSVIFFKIMVFIFKNIFRIKNVKFHPTEVTLIDDIGYVKRILENTGFSLVESPQSYRDLFTYVVVVAQKIQEK